MLPVMSEAGIVNGAGIDRIALLHGRRHHLARFGRHVVIARGLNNDLQQGWMQPGRIGRCRHLLSAFMLPANTGGAIIALRQSGGHGMPRLLIRERCIVTDG